MWMGKEETHLNCGICSWLWWYSMEWTEKRQYNVRHIADQIPKRM